MIGSDFNRDWKTFIHTCLNSLAIDADLIYEIFCCENEDQQKLPFERTLLTLHNGRNEKGFAKFAANTSLSCYCRTLSSLWHNHHHSRRQWTLPFSIHNKGCSEICFHWFRGLIDRRTKNANYAFFPSSRACHNKYQQKGWQTTMGWAVMKDFLPISVRGEETSCFHQF